MEEKIASRLLTRRDMILESLSGELVQRNSARSDPVTEK